MGCKIYGITLDSLLIIIALLLTSTSAVTYVHEVSKSSFKKFLDGKFFTLTYVDSPSCSRCRNLYPYFVAAAQAFPADPEIFFARTYDKELIKDWQIEELPALVYHKEGSNTPGFFHVDVTVDDIIDEIARLLHGNFASLVRYYSVRLTPKNYDEMVTTPKQSVMILIYDDETMDRFEMIEKAAYSFRKDDAILFATLDVERYEALRNERFMVRDVPSLMWLSHKDKSKVRLFGGMHTRLLIVTFINEQTGLNRNVEGAITSMAAIQQLKNVIGFNRAGDKELRRAGRIPEIDKLLEEHADAIHEIDPDRLNLLTVEILKLKDAIQPHMFEMLEYYIYVLDHLTLTATLSTLEKMYRGLETKLIEDEDLSTKAAETLKRHRNIVIFYQDLMKKFSSGEWAKQYGSRPKGERSVTLEAKTPHVHTEL